MRDHDASTHFDERDHDEHDDHAEREAGLAGPMPRECLRRPEVPTLHRVGRIGERGSHHRRAVARRDRRELERVREPVVEFVGSVEELRGDEIRHAAERVDERAHHREGEGGPEEAPRGAIVQPAELRGEQDEHGERGAVHRQLDRPTRGA